MAPRALPWARDLLPFQGARGEGCGDSTVAHFACKVRGAKVAAIARAENPTKSCPRALVMFATCSWPSLCEQSELQCWRRNRRLCGSVQISATRVLPLTFDISILNALPFRGAVASLPILIFLNFEHPTCPPENTSRKSCIPTYQRTPSQGRRITLRHQFSKERTVPSRSLSFCLHAALSFILFYPC